MPLIAIVRCPKLEDYRQSVLHTGGDVRLVDHSMSVSEALDDTGGLLLTGGDDVAPSLYGELPHESVHTIEPDRDEFEIALVQEARHRHLPILAICRGVQVLNVACGGSLVQDIPSQVPGALEHKPGGSTREAFALAHEVWVEKESLLGALMRDRLSGSDACEVNSRHHQAVKQPAAGFVVSATAPDGVIEAIEDPSTYFCLGVQWHPENFWRTGEFRPLFERFIEAAGQTPKA